MHSNSSVQETFTKIQIWMDPSKSTKLRAVRCFYVLKFILFISCQTFNCKIQWGSDVCISLDFEWSKRGWIANCLNFKWDLKTGSPTFWNLDKNIRILNGWDKLKPDHLKTRPFEIRFSKSPDFRSPLYYILGKKNRK